MTLQTTTLRITACIILWMLAGPARHAEAIELGDRDTAELEFRAGPSGKLGLNFKFADGKSQTLTGVVKADAQRRSVTKDGKKASEQAPMSDGLIEFAGPGWRLQYHTRPRLSRYTEPQQADLAQRWETLPGAGESWVPLEVRVDAGGAELWWAGRYGGRLQSESRLVEVSVKLNAGGEMRGERAFTRAATGRYLTLDVRRLALPGTMKNVTLSLKPGAQTLEKIPMLVADGAGHADVGVVKEMQGSRQLETDENTSRTSLDAMKESLLFSVPQEFYHRAWVLCAVEPDPKKDPVLTTRLTRFGFSGRGGAMADTTLTLPRGDEKPGAGIRQAGTVEFPVDGRKITAPLYLVQVDLKTGSILDLFSDTQDPIAPMKIGPYLDFEFLGKCDGNSFGNDRRRKPLASSTSAVHVFGVTLEKSPVEMRLKQAQPGNIFHNDETPETTFALRAAVPGRYTVRWEIRDVTGATLRRQEKTVELAATGSDTDITLPLAMPEVGWYGLRVTLADATGAALFEHDAAFALLGKDTRTAGYESPFGTWWFVGQLPVPAAGSMLLKAGLRRSTVKSLKESEADLAPWKVTLNQISWPFRWADLNDWPAAEIRAEKTVADTLKRFPNCEYIDLFHETYGASVYPPELYGQKYEPKDPTVLQQEDELFELGVKAARFFRAKFPQLKIIAGNSNGSAGIVAMMLRRGFPRDLIDYIGSEAGGQTIAPEKLTPHGPGGIWLMNETARTFGYDIPPTGCFEFTYRCESKLGARRHAEWYAQDMLLGLAYRFPTVSPAVLEDVSNAYFDTLWGASGLCQRQPLHYPKPAYVALATLTRVLDRVQLVQQMPTGSSSAHALEFERDGQRIYALWTPRGRCEMELEFPSDLELTGVGIYGRPEILRTSGRKLAVTAETGVRYLISPVPASRVTAGARTFPDHQPPAGTRVLHAMDDASAWQLAADELKPALPLRRPGQFEMRRVVDGEKGACLELQLKPAGELPAVVGEYTTLRLAQPVPIAGEPHTMGVWVKGDSSGGRVFWELEDAKGERWVSSNGFEGGDWGNHAAIDFDGWCFVTFALSKDSPAYHLEPQPGLGQWTHSAEGKLDFPLKLTGLCVQTHRQSLDLTRMRPVQGTIRLKDVSAIGAER